MAEEENGAKFNPFEQKMVEKPYAKDMIKASIGQYSDDEEDIPIPEATYKPPPVAPKPKTEDTSTPGQIPNEPISDELPQHEKLNLAEKTADSYIEAYSKFVPVPFIKFSSFNMKKMKALDLKGELSLKMIVTEDGTTVESYMKQFNARAEEIFTVSDEVKESIKEPLVEVIMEKGVELKPMARLGIAVGSHLVQMTQLTVELLMENKENINVFKDFKAKEDAENRMLGEKQMPPPSPQAETVAEETPNKPTETEDDSIEFEDVEYKKPPEKEVTVDDYINSENIIVEEEIND